MKFALTIPKPDERGPNMVPPKDPNGFVELRPDVDFRASEAIGPWAAKRLQIWERGLRLLSLLALVLFAMPVQAATAFFVEEYVGKLEKLCVYERLGDRYSITVSRSELCPVTIEV